MTVCCKRHIYSIRRVIYSYASEADRNEMMLWQIRQSLNAFILWINAQEVPPVMWSLAGRKSLCGFIAGYWDADACHLRLQALSSQILNIMSFAGQEDVFWEQKWHYNQIYSHISNFKVFSYLVYILSWQTELLNGRGTPYLR